MIKLKDVYWVPWADKAEWKEVREKVMSDNIEDIIQACEIMSIWKLKSSDLPAYIDCTFEILKVIVRDQQNEASTFSEYDLRLSYSTTIIRFVNHVHNASGYRSASLYSSAKTQQIPDWIVTLRHDAAHNQELPALETFQIAAKVSLQWLLKNYWFHEELSIDKMEPNIQVLGFDIVNEKISLDLLPVYKKAIKVWETCCDSLNHSLSSIGDLSEDQLFHIHELVSMCKNNKYIIDNRLHCSSLLRKIKTKSDKQNINDYLVKDLRRDVISLIRRISVDDIAMHTLVFSILQSDFMLDTSKQEWVNIIHFMQSLNCFPLFLRSLFQLVADEHDMAMNLLQSLAPSIQILQQCWSRCMLKSEKEGEKFWLKEKKKYFKKFKRLKVPLKFQKPPDIKLDMIQDLLKNPSIRCKNLIKDYLNLIKPPLPDALANEIITLINIYCDSDLEETSGDDNEKIYTIEDIGSFINEKDKTTKIEASENQLWFRSDISAEVWSSCPLGLLPHQQSVKLDIPAGTKWKSTLSENFRKRRGQPLETQSIEIKRMRKFLNENLTN